jgi:hypothetical protein
MSISRNPKNKGGMSSLMSLLAQTASVVVGALAGSRRSGRRRRPRLRPSGGSGMAYTWSPSRLTVGAYLTEMWLPSMASQVRATTLGGYRHNVRAYLVPRLGDMLLQRLTTARVGAFYSELVTSGGKGGRPLSPKTVRYVHTTLRRALRDAVADGLVVRNVASSRLSVRIGSITPGSCWQRWECVEANCWACAGSTWI